MLEGSQFNFYIKSCAIIIIAMTRLYDKFSCFNNKKEENFFFFVQQQFASQTTKILLSFFVIHTKGEHTFIKNLQILFFLSLL